MVHYWRVHTLLYSVNWGYSTKEGLQAFYKDAGLGGGLAQNRLIAQMAWSIPSTN